MVLQQNLHNWCGFCRGLITNLGADFAWERTLTAVRNWNPKILADSGTFYYARTKLYLHNIWRPLEVYISITRRICKAKVQCVISVMSLCLHTICCSLRCQMGTSGNWDKCDCKFCTPQPPTPSSTWLAGSTSPALRDTLQRHNVVTTEDIRRLYHVLKNLAQQWH